MIQSEVKLCPIHGETEFHFYETSGRNGQWKCLKCESELAILYITIMQKLKRNRQRKINISLLQKRFQKNEKNLILGRKLLIIII